VTHKRPVLYMRSSRALRKDVVLAGSAARPGRESGVYDD
jgi:hypothetical protein